MRFGIGGRAFGVRAGISTRGFGVGVGPLSAGHAWRRTGNRGRSSGSSDPVSEGRAIGTLVWVVLVVMVPWTLTLTAAILEVVVIWSIMSDRARNRRLPSRPRATDSLGIVVTFLILTMIFVVWAIAWKGGPIGTMNLAALAALCATVAAWPALASW